MSCQYFFCIENKEPKGSFTTHIHTCAHTHKHMTLIYIYIYIYSNDNYRYYFALLSIDYFLHCSLVALTVVFSFDPPNACLLIFSIGMTSLAFSFFSNIYFVQYIFFPLTVIRYIFSSSNHLPVCFFYHKGYYLIYIYIYIYI